MISTQLRSSLARGVRGGRGVSPLSSPLPRQPLPLPRASTDPQPLDPSLASSLGRLKKDELVKRARAAGVPIHGTKAEIAARLAQQEAGSGQVQGSIGRPRSRHGVTMEDALRPGGALSQAIAGSLKSQLEQGIMSGSGVIIQGGGWQVEKLPSGGHQGNSNGAASGSLSGGHDILDPFSGKPMLEALGEQLSIQQSKNGDDKAEKWIGEVSVIQVATPKAKAKKQGQQPGSGNGSGGTETDEEIKLQVLIRVVGKSREEVEATIQQEASRDRGAGQCTAIGNVWKESEQEEHMMEMLGARYA